MRALAVCVVVTIGCSSSTTVTVDASPIKMDAAAGSACTGALYDPCTMNSQCMSMNCHFYMQSNFTICTQTCTPGNNSTCPVDRTGVNGVCNNMGNCKPAQANNCTR